MSTSQQLSVSYFENTIYKLKKSTNQRLFKRDRPGNACRKILNIFPRGGVFFRLMEINENSKNTIVCINIENTSEK